jgi:hypothetical protein
MSIADLTIQNAGDSSLFLLVRFASLSLQPSSTRESFASEAPIFGEMLIFWLIKTPNSETLVHFPRFGVL